LRALVSNAFWNRTIRENSFSELEHDKGICSTNDRVRRFAQTNAPGFDEEIRRAFEAESDLCRQPIDSALGPPCVSIRLPEIASELPTVRELHKFYCWAETCVAGKASN